jgi:hypothetical protein
MTREIGKPTGGQPLTPTRRDLLKFAALAVGISGSATSSVKGAPMGR